MSFLTAPNQNPRISFECDVSKVPEQDIKWLISTLEGRVKAGTVYRAGETLQIGWMIMKFMQAQESLKLHEPDMRSMPIVFVDSVTNTLLHLRVQKDTYESCAFQRPIQYPAISQFMVAHKSYPSAPDFILSRQRAQDNDSGWMFRPLGANADAPAEEYDPISLYEFACRRPELIKFFALPEGTIVHIAAQDQIRVLEDDSELPVRSGSFLDAINRARQH